MPPTTIVNVEVEILQEERFLLQSLNSDMTGTAMTVTVMAMGNRDTEYCHCVLKTKYHILNIIS